MLEVRGLDARSVAPPGWKAKDSWSFYAERLSTHALWPDDDAWAQLPAGSLEAPELERRAAEAARARLQQRAAASIQRAWRAARQRLWRRWLAARVAAEAGAVSASEQEVARAHAARRQHAQRTATEAVRNARALAQRHRALVSDTPEQYTGIAPEQRTGSALRCRPP